MWVACSNGGTVESPGGQDDVRRERDQLRRVFANLGGIGRGPARLDPHIAADGPAEERQLLIERSEARLKYGIFRVPGRRIPIVFICWRWARAESGQAAAEPAIIAMKSRRRTQLPPEPYDAIYS